MPTTRVKSYRRKDGTIVKASRRQTRRKKKTLIDDPIVRNRYIEQSKSLGIPVTRDNVREVYKAQTRVENISKIGFVAGGLGLSYLAGKNYLDKNPSQDYRKLLDERAKNIRNIRFNELAEQFRIKAEQITSPSKIEKTGFLLKGTKAKRGYKSPNILNSLEKEANKIKRKARVIDITSKVLNTYDKAAYTIGVGMEKAKINPYSAIIGTGVVSSTAGLYAANKAARKSKSKSKKRTSKYKSK